MTFLICLLVLPLPSALCITASYDAKLDLPLPSLDDARVETSSQRENELAMSAKRTLVYTAAKQTSSHEREK
jgi:hypothetical protein